MVPPWPTAETRWRCAQCGNLTRFDVTRTSRTEEFVHADLAGETTVEVRNVLADTIEKVACQWCGSTDQVELVPRPDATDTPVRAAE